MGAPPAYTGGRPTATWANISLPFSKRRRQTAPLFLEGDDQVP